MPTILDDLRDGNSPPSATISIEQYQQRIEAGVMPKGTPIELNGGVLVLKDRRDRDDGSFTSYGSRHASVVRRLPRLLAPLENTHEPR